MRKALFLLMAMFAVTYSSVSCSGGKDDEIDVVASVSPLSRIDDVSLSYHASSQSVSLGRDVQKEGATVSLKKGVSWINNITLSKSVVTFDVEENSNTSVGHRFDTLFVTVKGKQIGYFCITQARNPFSGRRLVWANSDALYRSEAIGEKKLSGLEVTKRIYNLEKTTNGKDSYKNYPAFAFCIEMNHNPDKNIEWYLPSEEELRSYAHNQSYAGTPIEKHNYWWSSTENTLEGWRAFNVFSGSIASRGAVSKGEDWWVVAFRNGKIEE